MVKVVHILDVKYVDIVISKLLNYQSKLRIDPKDIPQFKIGTHGNYKYKFLTASSKLDSITSVMNSLHPIPVVSTIA